jgi:hypothetical protein
MVRRMRLSVREVGWVVEEIGEVKPHASETGQLPITVCVLSQRKLHAAGYHLVVRYEMSK